MKIRLTTFFLFLVSLKFLMPSEFLHTSPSAVHEDVDFMFSVSSSFLELSVHSSSLYSSSTRGLCPLESDKSVAQDSNDKQVESKGTEIERECGSLKDVST